MGSKKKMKYLTSILLLLTCSCSTLGTKYFATPTQDTRTSYIDTKANSKKFKN